MVETLTVTRVYSSLFHCLSEIVDAILNIYCHLDEKMYVKVPMTLTITVKNSSKRTLHLKCSLKNADNFMFSGNTHVSYTSRRKKICVRLTIRLFALQLNIAIFANSSYSLSYNLYPLKAGWQRLPEFEFKYNTPTDVIAEQRQEDLLNDIELQNLVNRWMPKKVFILVSMIGAPLSVAHFSS